MIRINLLETAQKKRRKRALPSGAPAVVLYLLLLVLESLLLYYWYSTKDDALAALTRLNQEAQTRLDGFNKLQAETDELKKKMSEEQQQADIFDRLGNATVGPANALLYLAYMLTTPPLANHAERVVQEQIGWNTQWDPDRAWFSTLQEGKENKLTITGRAISHHDADEVLNRLKASIYFQGVHFVSAKIAGGASQEKGLVELKIEAALNYDPEVGKAAPAEAPDKTSPPGKGKPDAGKKGGGKG